MIRLVSNAEHVSKRLNEIENTLTRAAFAIMEDGIGHIQKRMEKPGNPIRYPVNWDSFKQMRAFFATNGFGEGIPYRRKNEHVKSWQMRPIKDGFELRNTKRSAVYLYGRADGLDISPSKKQSNIHKGRWPLFRPVVDEEIQQLPKKLIARIRLEQ